MRAAACCVLVRTTTYYCCCCCCTEYYLLGSTEYLDRQTIFIYFCSAASRSKIGCLMLLPCLTTTYYVSYINNVYVDVIQPSRIRVPTWDEADLFHRNHACDACLFFFVFFLYVVNSPRQQKAST